MGAFGIDDEFDRKKYVKVLTKAEKLDRLKTRVAVFYENHPIIGPELTQSQKERVACYKIGEAEKEMFDLMGGEPDKYWAARRKVKMVEADMVDYVFTDSEVSDSKLDEIARESIEFNSMMRNIRKPVEA